MGRCRRGNNCRHVCSKSTQLISGSDCLTLSRFHDNLLQAGVVITGEGKIDLQSFYRKIPGTVGKPVSET